MQRRQILAVHLKRLEEIFGSPESFVTNCYNFAIGQLEVLFELITVFGPAEGLVVVEGDEAEVLLDLSDKLIPF